MTKMTFNNAYRATAAALLALAMSAAAVPVMADTAPKQTEARIDRTTTGAIPATSKNDLCTGASLKTGSACSKAGAEGDYGYPSAPVNAPFGF
jgi:hypothetical protein